MVGLTFGEMVFLGKLAAITALLVLGFIQPIITNVLCKLPIITASIDL